MSTETFHPQPFNPETTSDHEVVQGEVVNKPEAKAGFIEDALNGETSYYSESTDAGKKNSRRPVVETINPENVHLYGDLTLKDVIQARTVLGLVGEEGRDEDIKNLVNAMVPEASNKAYARHKGEVAKLLGADEERFEKLSARFIKSQARRDSVNLKSSLEEADENHISLAEKVRNLFKAESSNDSEIEDLVSIIASTKTRSDYLDRQFKEFQGSMEAFKKSMDPNLPPAEAAEVHNYLEDFTVRKMVQRLVNDSGLEDDERTAYEDNLVNTFLRYVKLSDEDRKEVHSALDARSASKDEELSQTERSKKSKRGLGATAANLVITSRNRWEARKVGKAETQDQDEHEPANERFARMREALKRAKNPKDYYAEFMTNRTMRAHDEANMTAEERAATREKRNNRKAFVALGAIGLAAASTYLVYKYGFDTNNGGSGGRNGTGNEGGTNPFDDLFNIPGDNKPGGNGGDSLSRSELFDGSEGTRTLTNANAEHLKEFLGDYKVKASDDKGVWGISEKYLHSQGIKNPTVFEIDSTKDFILKNSSLTENSILHPGDTIKIK